MNTHFSRPAAGPWLLTLLLALLPLASVRAADTVTCAYDAAGRLVLMDYGNGRSVRYVFDAAGNLLRRLILTNTDSDGDGLDDTWETFFFSNLARNGTGDADSDGQSDLAEFLAGTDPTNAGSVLVVRRDLTAAGGTATIEWSAVPGKRYRVQFKDTISDAAWQDLVGDVTAGAATATKADTAIVGRPERYYRVILAP